MSGPGAGGLRILHVIASVDRASGGPAQAIVQGLETHRTLGHRVETVSLDAPDASAIAEFPGVVHGMGPTLRRYGYTPRLACWIAENGARFDVAVIHGLWNHASIGGWQGCRRARLPYVIFTHGMMDPWFRRAYPLKHWVKQAFWLVQSRVLRDAHEVLFTCEEERRLAEGVFFGSAYRGRVVAFGAPDALVSAAYDEPAFHDLLPYPNARPYLLFLGRIHEKKGVDLLLHGFAHATRRPDLQLVIAGPEDGDLGRRLRAQAARLGISGRVHWPGMVKDEAKASAFRSAEAFVLTSHQENFGIAVVEALAHAKPVLISDQINIWREIEAGGGGLVASDTAEGATELIARWEAMTLRARTTMGRAARAVYEANFTVEAAARDLTAVLERAAATRKSVV